MEELLKTSWEKGISITAYDELLQSFALEGKTSGPNQSEEMAHYTKLNAHRSKRVEKQVQLSDAIAQQVNQIVNPQKWLVLSETWCGDAANNLPILRKIADLNEHFEIRVLFRDENEELMNQFLTNGGKSIPKLIAMDQNWRVLFDWGPRPQEAQELYWNWRNSEHKIPYSEFHVVMQKWYMADKGASTQQELLDLLQS